MCVYVCVCVFMRACMRDFMGMNVWMNLCMDARWVVFPRLGVTSVFDWHRLRVSLFACVGVWVNMMHYDR